MKKHLLKTCSWTMAVCMLLSALTACNPNVPPADGTSSETAGGTVEDASAHYQTPVIRKTGNTPFYEGKTGEELYAIYTQNGGGELSAHVMQTGWFYHTSNGGETSYVSFYDKCKGEFLPLCGDPQCPGGDGCVWNGMSALNYTSADHIFFVSRDSAGDSAIYRSDLARQNLDMLISFAREDTQVYNPDGTPLGEPTRLLSARVLHEQGDSVYFESQFFANGKFRKSLCVMDVSTRKITALSGRKDIASMKFAGGRVIYSLTSTPYNWYETDLTFEKSKIILKSVDIVLLSGQYLILQKREGDRSTTAYQSYHLNTEETIELGEFMGNMGRTAYLSGDYLYYIRSLSDEEIANDPLHDYYTYQWEDKTADGRPFKTHANTRGGGRVYRVKVNEADAPEECVLQLTYKDVPVRIQSIEMDGEVIYVTFHNYEGFKNFYNRDFDGDEESSVCYGMADLQNGSFTLLSPAKKE